MQHLTPPPVSWSLAKLVGFRFAFTYWFAYLLPWALAQMPWTDWPLEAYVAVATPLVRWLSTAVLGMDQPVEYMPNGSGDTSFDYIFQLVLLLVALVVTVVWSVVDRRRPNYAVLAAGLRVYFRYLLGMILLTYGIIKIIPSQFPAISDIGLVSGYGDSSPMGLLWRFMGHSPGYNVFVGIAEAGAGVLLFWRRTTLLGALLGIGVMANIVALNFFYDVPVKLFSTHVLLGLIVLAATDVPRLVRLFLLNRPVSPGPERARFPRLWQERARRVAKVVVIGWVTYSLISSTLERSAQRHAPAERPAHAGIWQPRDATHAWRYFVVSARGTRLSVGVRPARGEMSYFRVKPDTDPGTLVLINFDDEEETEHELRFTLADDGTLRVTGTLVEEAVDVVLERVERDSFLLVRRGFRWINEKPFNR